MTFLIGWPLASGARKFGYSQLLPANQSEPQSRAAGHSEEGRVLTQQHHSTALDLTEEGNIMSFGDFIAQVFAVAFGIILAGFISFILLMMLGLALV